MRNRTTTPTGHTVKKMNENVYTERRKVIDCIYKAKFLLRNNKIEMPRIDVRITETEKTSNLGVAQMNGKYIWIPAHTLNMSSLYQTVLHELCHAIWGIGHDNKCKLMHPILQNISDSEAEKIFLQYAIKHSGK